MQEELESAANALAESQARSQELEARVQGSEGAAGAGTDQVPGETGPTALGQGGDSASMQVCLFCFFYLI